MTNKILIPPDIAAQMSMALESGGHAVTSRIVGGIPAAKGQWAKHYFPDRFNRPFAKYQEEFWDWADTINKTERARPRVECEPRGVGKSSSARAIVVYLLAKRIKSYCLYICATDAQAQKHFNAIRSMLETEQLLKDYPHLRPQSQKHRPNVNKSWSSERLVTADGQVVEFISLLGNARGFTTEEGKRPDIFCLDDIDDSKDSPYMVSKKLDILRTSIIPAKAENTLILFPQNLIHRNSICQQVLDGRADIISDREFVGPYPLMRWYESERVEMHDGTGAKKWKITAGEPFDPALTVEYCEYLLNDGGKESFDLECQQEVHRVGTDKDFREWDEVFHLITYSEFRRFYEGKANVWNEKREKPQIPPNWAVGLGLDFGTTPEHPSAVVYVARPNVLTPLSNSYFVFAETILPKYPLPMGEEVPLVSPGRVAQAVKETLSEWNVSEKQITAMLMSHEQSAALNTMRIDLKDELKTFFSKWKAKKGSGVPQIQELLVIDRTEPHPFRENIKGKPRIYFICADEQAEMYEQDGKKYVRQPFDSLGFARARFEIPIFSQYNSGSAKIDDDFCDSLRGLMNVFAVNAPLPTYAELVEIHTPEVYRDAPPVNTPAYELSRLFAVMEAKKRASATGGADDMVVFEDLDL